MKSKNIWWMLVLALGLFLTGTHATGGGQTAQPMAGRFECRNWDIQPTVLLAVVVLHGDGSYEATDRVEDLNAHRPSARGRYNYDEIKQQIHWTSGGWKDRIGTYMPQVKGTDFVVVHTRKDPEGKVDGALRCVRTASSR